MEEATWNSLEIVKLIVAGLTPLLVAAIAFWLNRRLKSLEQAQWAQQKIVERRITAYDQLARPLNELFCFFCYVGTWKEIAPPDVVRLKRKLDQNAHISAPLFDPTFLPQYNTFMDACFQTFGRWGADAKLRTLTDRRTQAVGSAWKPEWNQCFTERDEATEPSTVMSAYSNLMAYLATAIGVAEVDAHLFGSTRLPGNFDQRAAGTVSRIRPDRDVSVASPD